MKPCIKCGGEDIRPYQRICEKCIDGMRQEEEAQEEMEAFEAEQEQRAIEDYDNGFEEELNKWR